MAAAERDRRDAVGGHPVGVEAAVGDLGPRRATDRADGRGRGHHAGLVFGEPKRLVVEPALDRDLPRLAVDAFDLLRRLLERHLDRLHDLVAKRRVVAAGLGLEGRGVGDDVGRGAGMDHAHVARAALALLRHEPVPAILHERCDRQRCNRHRRHALFGGDAGMARHPLDPDVEPVAARGTDRDLLDRAPIEVEGELWPAEIGRIRKPRAPEAHLLLDREEERQRWMGDVVPQDLERRREHDRAAGPVVGPETGHRIGALYEPPRHHRLRTEADRHRVHVGHEQSPRAGERARQLDDQVADIALERRLGVRLVERDRRLRAARLAKPLHDPLGDGLFIAGAATNREQVEDDAAGGCQIGRRDRGGAGCRCRRLLFYNAGLYTRLLHGWLVFRRPGFRGRGF